MVVDLSDKSQQQRKLASRQRRQQASTRQQKMAVDRGSFRVKSEEGLEVGTAEDPTGSQVVYGILRIIGQLIGQGDIDWGGEVNLRGPVAITGENGTLTVDAETLLRGLTRLLDDLVVEAAGKIKVGTGDQIVIDGATRRITVGTGASQIVINGDTGEITVPGSNPIRLHQVAGLARVDLGTTAGIWSAGDGVTIAASVPGGYMNIYSGGIDIAGGVGRPGISLDDTGINVGIPPSGSGSFLGVDANGYLVRVSGGTGGGPGDGVFAWPYSLDLVTSEFRSAERPGHDGIDFGNGIAGVEGTPIPAAGAGIVETVGVPGTGHGWGYYVVIDHGTDPLYGGAHIRTRYAHMYQMPAVSVGDPVALGMTLGGIGNTGNSDGEHLHYEVIADGDWVNPRTFHAAHGG